MDGGGALNPREFTGGGALLFHEDTHRPFVDLPCEHWNCGTCCGEHPVYTRCGTLRRIPYSALHALRNQRQVGADRVVPGADEPAVRRGGSD